MATTRDWLRMAVRAAGEKKAQQLVALDVRGLSSVTDYFVVCSGTSDTHVRAIAEHVRDTLEAKGQRTYGFEGYTDGTWVLLDYVDFVMHVFHHEKRAYFGIEDLWADAKKVTFRAAPAAKSAAVAGAAAPPKRARRTARAGAD